MSTTEIATLPLYGHKGLNFASQDPEEREAIDFSVKLISRQPGCRNVGYSEKHEDNEVTIMIVGEWQLPATCFTSSH